MPDPADPQADALPDDIQAMPFEEALDELERIVKSLETASQPLEAQIQAYARGALLRRHCEAKLRDAQMRVEQIGRQADGTLATGPAELGGGA